MANAVEQLFESVLARLGPEPKDTESVGRTGADTYDPVDQRTEFPEEGLTTLDEERLIQRNTDIIAGAPWRGDVTPSEEEIFEGGIRHIGFEVLAFYKSRRFIARAPYPKHWGIFYLRQGLQFVEMSIAREYPGYGNPRELAYGFVREHERFHFRADLQTLMLEAATARHLYAPLRNAFRGKRTEFVEEALANRQTWDWSKRAQIGLREFSYEFLKLQPNAYARFDDSRLELAAEWAANVVDLDVARWARREDIAHWVEASPSTLMRTSLCPQYVVYPGRLESWLSPALVVPPVASVVDGPEVTKRLNTKLMHLRQQWSKTKEKLLANRLLRGLNFKPWPKEGNDVYSVRVDDNFRAHLKHDGGGQWTAYILGPHKELGHG